MADTWRNAKKTAGEILPWLYPGTVVCVFDTETTGLIKKDRSTKIIQFSAVRARITEAYQFEEIDYIDLYINPEEKLSPKITAITGITDEMLEDKPSERALATVIFDYMYKSDTWAAYNKHFDLTMLDMMADRVGMYFDPNPSVDVLEFSRDWVNTPDHKLGTVHKYLYPNADVHFHSSIDDVRATIDIMNALVPRYASLMEKEEDKKQRYLLEYSYAWINPLRETQQRICIKLDQGERGDIYYDCIKKRWGHKSTKSAKKLFDAVDLVDVECQVLKKSSNRYVTYTSMEQLARDRISFARKKLQEKKKASAQ